MNAQRCAQRVRSALLVACTALLTSSYGTPSTTQPVHAPISHAGSGLSISAPGAPVAAGSGAPGSSFSTDLGTVTVTAPTGATTWTASVALTSSFRVTQNGQTWVLPNDRVSYRTGSPVSSLLGLLAGCPTSGAKTLDQTQEVLTCSRSLVLGGVAGSVSWNPTLTIQTQPTDPAGTYTGTITHSVA